MEVARGVSGGGDYSDHDQRPCSSFSMSTKSQSTSTEDLRSMLQVAQTLLDGGGGVQETARAIVEGDLVYWLLSMLAQDSTSEAQTPRDSGKKQKSTETREGEGEGEDRTEEEDKELVGWQLDLLNRSVSLLLVAMGTGECCQSCTAVMVI